MTLSVKGGKNLKKNYVGKNCSNYDYYVVLSHFKGHTMAGFGGSIKNISIGIASSKLASYDPVALDQACVDLVYAAEDGAKLVKRIESGNGLHTLEHAEKIGIGSMKYSLKSID